MRRLLLLLIALAAPVFAQDKPNVVILFADDLGYGDLSSYGHPIIRTPHLDGLASEGIRLTSFYSAPWCVPARAQLLMGRYEQRIQMGATGSGGRDGIPEQERTLAEALGAVGYRTAMVGKWHLGSASPDYLPTGRGFDSWLGLPYSNDMRRPWVNSDAPLWLFDGPKKIENPVDQDTLTTRYAARAVDFIESAEDDPFFLYFAYSMPHLPLHTAQRFRGRSRAGLFGDVIETIDWAAGEVLAALEATGHADDTIVVFTSDNGPWLNLPDRMLAEGVQRWHAGTPGLLRGAKHTIYEGGVRVPGIIRWPGVVEPGRVSPELVSTMDVHATLLSAAGASSPELPLDGLDLTAFLQGDSASPRDEFFYFHRNQLKALRLGPWKLKIDGTGPELYQLELDPSELYNRAADMPDVVERLQQRIDEMKKELGMS